MTQPQFRNWQAIQAEVLRRIHARDWPPGHVIPGEVDLAAEFGCARATVNRALQALAEDGVLERRRKAGTRVALYPVSRATLEIPVIRQEVEEAGKTYSYQRLTRTIGSPADLHVTALHLADGKPHIFEDRRIKLTTVPQAEAQGFEDVSANEWLLANVPYTHGDIAFAAAAASHLEASALQIPTKTPVFVIERTTWDHNDLITTVRLTCAPGHVIRTQLGR